MKTLEKYVSLDGKTYERRVVDGEIKLFDYVEPEQPEKRNVKLIYIFTDHDMLWTGEVFVNNTEEENKKIYLKYARYGERLSRFVKMKVIDGDKIYMVENGIVSDWKPEQEQIKSLPEQTNIKWWQFWK